MTYTLKKMTTIIGLFNDLNYHDGLTQSVNISIMLCIFSQLYQFTLSFP